LNKISLSDDYWYEPIVTSAVHPFVVFSAGDVLDVYDSKLNFVKNSWPKELYLQCMLLQVLGEGPNAPFAAIYEGRGGWHMSILCVFIR
jgi:hypothetical protein